MNLSHPKQCLVTPEPDPESYLPVDDGNWDSGVSAEGCLLKNCLSLTT